MINKKELKTAMFNAPLVLTYLAGISTLLGAFLGILSKKPSPKVLSFSLGFAAGIMILIALNEMLPEAYRVSPILSYLFFIFGMIFYFVLEKGLPQYHPCELYENNLTPKVDKKRLQRVAILLTVSISLHNFPEGIATFVSANANLDLGIGVSLAVAIHNIPEGLAVAAPVYMATNSKKQALFWAAVSGCSEILGGLLTYWIFGDLISETTMAMIMAFVAGIMVTLSINELIPLAKEISPKQNPSFSILIGMSVMGLSLILLSYF